MDDSPYFYRVRGRLFGPIPLRQARQLVQQAQISRTTDVSRDGVQWAKASDCPELFVAAALPPPPVIGDPAPAAMSRQPPAPDQIPPPVARWFYTVNGSQQGPVDLPTLQQLVAIGTVSANDHVIREGDSQWVSATKVPAPAGTPHAMVAAGGGRRPGHQGSNAKGGTLTVVASIGVVLLGLVGWIGAYMLGGNAAAPVTGSRYRFAILDDAVALDGRQASLPVSFSTLVEMIGRPNRTSNLANTIHTWDDLGILAYQRPGESSISELRFCFRPESFDISPQSDFDSLVVNGVTLSGSATEDDLAAAGFQRGDYFWSARLGRTRALGTFNEIGVPGVKDAGLVAISCSKSD